MHILLINTNPVVSRLMKLCVKEEHALLDEVSSVDNIKNKPYDIVFIDDMIYGEISHDVLQRIDHNKLVLFSAKKDIDVPSFIDEVITKPFLPSRVIEVIESVEERYPHTTISLPEKKEVSEEIFEEPEEPKEDISENMFIAQMELIEEVFEEFVKEQEEPEEEISKEIVEEQEEPKETISENMFIDQEEPEEEVFEEIIEEHNDNILDINEIEKIKSLLETNENEVEVEHEPDWEDDQELEKLKREVIKQNLIDEGLEIVEEDVLNAIEPDLNLHIIHDINDESRHSFEQELLKAIQKMKIKKLKKLLKGAQITINVRFKDDNE